MLQTLRSTSFSMAALLVGSVTAFPPASGCSVFEAGGRDIDYKVVEVKRQLKDLELFRDCLLKGVGEGVQRSRDRK